MTEALFVTHDGVQFFSDDYGGMPEVRFAVMPMSVRIVPEGSTPDRHEVSIRSFHRKIVEVDLGFTPAGLMELYALANAVRRANPELYPGEIAKLVALEPKLKPRRVLRWFEYREAAGEPLAAWEIAARGRTWREVAKRSPVPGPPKARSRGLTV